MVFLLLWSSSIVCFSTHPCSSGRLMQADTRADFGVVQTFLMISPPSLPQEQTPATGTNPCHRNPCHRNPCHRNRCQPAACSGRKMATKFLTLIIAAVLLVHLPVPAASVVKGTHNRTNDWGKQEYVHCVQPYTWRELVYGYKNSRVVYKVGGLGRLLEEGGYQTWQCFPDHYCATDDSDPWFCFVYHETEKVFTPWGENSRLELVRNVGLCQKEAAGQRNLTCDNTPIPFFSVSGVQYPSSDTFPEVYTARKLSPFPKLQGVPVETKVWTASSGCAATSGAAWLSFFVDGAWTSEKKFFSSMSKGAIAVVTTVISGGFPTKLKIRLDGTDGWNFWKIRLTILGKEFSIGIDGSAGGGSVFGWCGDPAPSMNWEDYWLDGDEIGRGIPRSREWNIAYVCDLLTCDGRYAGTYCPGTATFSTIDISDTISSDSKYWGGVLHSNGKIYYAPHDSNKVGEFDPLTKNFSVIDLPSPVSGGSYQYHGGVLTSNGTICFIPIGTTSNIGEFNPLTRTFTVIDISAFISSDPNHYMGGVLGPNGIIYCIPSYADNVGEFNPVTRTFSVIDISSTISSEWKYAGGVLAPNSMIYFIPQNADNIGELNPVTRTFSVIDISSTISSDNKYVGGVLAPNGMIYFIPYFADNVGELNPVSRTFSIIDTSSTISSDRKYHGGVLGPNGKIYCIPFNANSIGVFDPSTKVFSTIDVSATTGTGNEKYAGGVVAGNNRIYLVPRNADNIGELELGNTDPAYEVEGGVPEAWRALLSPHFNKL